MKEVFLSELKKSFTTSYHLMVNIGGGLLPFLLFLYSFEMSVFNSVLYAILFFLVFFIIHLSVNIWVRVNNDLLLSKDMEIGKLKTEIAQFQKFYGISEGLSPSQLFPYTFLESHLDREIVFKKETLEFETVSTMKIKLQSNCENLDQVPHSISIANMAFNFGSFLPELVSCSRKGNNDASLEEEKNDKSKQNYCVNFSPPLKQDEEIEYVIQWRYPKAKFISYEEFYAAKRYGFLPKSRDTEYFTRTTTIPCESFRSSVKFPKHYKVSIKEGFSVKKKKQDIAQEIIRVQKNGFFHNRISNDSQELSLNILKPTTGLTYYLLWEPLRLKELVSLNFISAEEKAIIENRIATEESYKEWYLKQ